jgi:hypothetical protein
MRMTNALFDAVGTASIEYGRSALAKQALFSRAGAFGETGTFWQSRSVQGKQEQCLGPVGAF